ncbi:XrtA system polysaccharide deacetylase [Vibrio alfacsensis]|uniref:XrtA system polysaccharide deacetylase n=1 Tax=Vibrio alfacsensis TaxID=1074311 RepID=UPI004068D0D0
MLVEQNDSLSQKILCAMTVDVEDYFHVAAFDKVIQPSEWGTRYPMRVEANTQRVLQLFSDHDVKATFFMLGWVADSCPQLVRTIIEEGHELASHGFSHQKITSQSPLEFKQDVLRSKHLLEDIGGVQVQGYRAPSFSLNPKSEWAFEILADLGFLYSSSTYPVQHDHYGAPNWPKSIYRRPEGIYEIPIPTLHKLSRSVPIGGGGFFRLYPYYLSKTLINGYLHGKNQSYSFYFHPWEIDSSQPRIEGVPIKSHFRHYLNLSRMETRIRSLLTDFSWNTMSHVFQLDGRKNDSKIIDQRDDTPRYARLG